jgi:hypothetical protein
LVDALPQHPIFAAIQEELVKLEKSVSKGRPNVTVNLGENLKFAWWEGLACALFAMIAAYFALVVLARVFPDDWVATPIARSLFGSSQHAACALSGGDFRSDGGCHFSSGRFRMISIGVVESASGAANYYARDNYYAGPDAEAMGNWFGRGAEKLGLTGGVDAQVFEAVLAGQLPNGSEIKAASGAEHRAALDLVFAPPKSVSLMALVGRDQRLLGALEASARTTLGSRPI